MIAGTASLAPSGDAEHIMLHLDDELAGLLEAADMPANEAGTHSSKPEAASPGPGETRVVHSTSCACRFALSDCSMVMSALLCFALLLLTSQCWPCFLPPVYHKLSNPRCCPSRLNVHAALPVQQPMQLTCSA